jgi:2'-5' RNA ligase
MKAGLVLLIDDTMHNMLRRVAYELHRDYRLGFHGALIPPHISLKQPFQIADLDALEAFFDEFTAGITPFEVMLDGVEVLPASGPTGDTGLVWVAVRESPVLRGLHDRLNVELAARFTNTAADFDGPSYRFHITIATGGQPPEVYQRIASELQPPRLPHRTTIRKMLLCYIDDDSFAPGTYITYKTLTLGSVEHKA